MLQHHELDNITGITDRQREMLKVIINYDQGWIDEETLEKDLRKVLMSKKKKDE